VLCRLRWKQLQCQDFSTVSSNRFIHWDFPNKVVDNLDFLNLLAVYLFDLAHQNTVDQAVQYGCIRTRFEKEFDTISELRQEMEAGRYTICVHPEAAFKVKTAGLLKRSLKEIHALGGD